MHRRMIADGAAGVLAIGLLFGAPSAAAAVCQWLGAVEPDLTQSQIDVGG